MRYQKLGPDRDFLEELILKNEKGSKEEVATLLNDWLHELKAKEQELHVQPPQAHGIWNIRRRDVVKDAMRLARTYQSVEDIKSLCGFLTLGRHSLGLSEDEQSMLKELIPVLEGITGRIDDVAKSLTEKLPPAPVPHYEFVLKNIKDIDKAYYPGIRQALGYTTVSTCRALIEQGDQLRVVYGTLVAFFDINSIEEEDTKDSGLIHITFDRTEFIA